MPLISKTNSNNFSNNKKKIKLLIMHQYRYPSCKPQRQFQYLIQMQHKATQCFSKSSFKKFIQLLKSKVGQYYSMCCVPLASKLPLVYGLIRFYFSLVICITEGQTNLWPETQTLPRGFLKVTFGAYHHQTRENKDLNL